MLKLTNFYFFRKVNRTTLIAILCASFLTGLSLPLCGIRLYGWWIVLGLVVLSGCARRRLIVAVPAAVVAGLVLGLCRGSQTYAQIMSYQGFIEHRVDVSGLVLDDAAYGDKGQRDFKLGNVRVNGQALPGAVRITSFSVGEAKRGDNVEASGKMYQGFGNYQAAIYFANARVVQTNPNMTDQLRRQFAASIYSSLPSTEASLGIGILLGIKTDLPDDLNNNLKTLSLTHVVVASGYNLTILVRLARRLFEKQSKYQTALAAGLMMACFVAVTGFSASMSRAALVSGLSLAAWYWGRRIHPMVLLLFAAAVTAGSNPLFLWGDLGWWLSFLAFAGVLILAPLLQARIFGPKREPKLIGQIVLETISAQIMALPLMLAVFGNPSLLSLLANVLIVPLVPLIMLLTFAGGLAGLVVPALAAYVVLPAGWLLSYVVQLIGLLSGVKWAMVPLRVSMTAMVVCYLVISLFALLLWRKTRHDFLAKSVIE